MKWIFLIQLMFSFSIRADVKVEWGEGQLKLTDTGGSKELQGHLKILQTQLLIDNEVSDVLLTKQKKTLVVTFDYSSKDDLAGLKANLKGNILKTAAIKTPKPSPEPSNDDQQAKKNESDKNEDEPNYEIENNKSLVIVGNNDEYFVEEGEVVQQLVVLGGKVKIEGQVNRLVLISGKVDILANGKVNEKVTQLAGDINVDQGGFVTKDKTGFFEQFKVSSLIIDQFTDISGTSGKLVLALIRFIQVVFLLWLSLRIIPYFNTNLLDKNYSWFKEGLTGLLHLCVVPFLMLVLSITVVGISLVPVYAFLLYLLGLLGYGLLSSILGYKLLCKRNSQSQPSFMLSFILGFLVFEFLILIPVLGYLVLAILLIVSVGLMTNVFMKYRKAI